MDLLKSTEHPSKDHLPVGAVLRVLPPPAAPAQPEAQGKELEVFSTLDSQETLKGGYMEIGSV